MVSNMTWDEIREMYPEEYVVIAVGGDRDLLDEVIQIGRILAVTVEFLHSLFLPCRPLQRALVHSKKDGFSLGD